MLKPVVKKNRKPSMTDVQLLLISVLGIAAFYLVVRYINNRIKGKPHEERAKKSLTKISIIFGVAMTFQIIAVIWRMFN